MSEFEKELDGILEIIKDEKFYNSKLYALPSIEELKAHFKDWQPPKELVEVPQIVADFIKAMIAKDLKPLINSSKFGELGFTEEKLQEILHWINEHQEEYMRAWLDGYTVEKEKKYILKHIDMSKLSADESLYLTHGMYKRLMHARYSKDVDMSKIEQCHFTQSEIDKLHTGSYEQIPVKVDEVEG